MGSYVQVIVGGILLVTAFLFGRHINNQPILPTSNQTQLADANSLKRQKPQTPNPIQSGAATSNSLQKSLRERILGNREKKRNQPNMVAQAPAQKKEASPFVLPEQEVVVPDFSRLDFAKPPMANGKAKPQSRLPKAHVEPAIAAKIDDVVVGPIPKETAKKTAIALPKRRPDRISSVPRQDLVTKRGKMRVLKSNDYLVPIRPRDAKLTGKTDKFVSYKTVFGDTLHSLSSRFFGKPDYYLDIYAANKDRMSNPSTVPVNVTLRIPLVADLINQPEGN